MSSAAKSSGEISVIDSKRPLSSRPRLLSDVVLARTPQASSAPPSAWPFGRGKEDEIRLPPAKTAVFKRRHDALLQGDPLFVPRERFSQVPRASIAASCSWKVGPDGLVLFETDFVLAFPLALRRCRRSAAGRRSRGCEYERDAFVVDRAE